MKLYHRQFLALSIMVILSASLLFVSCNAPSRQPSQMTIDLTADGKTIPVQVLPNSTVQDVLTSAKITLGSLDRVEPPQYTVLLNGTSVRVVRMREEFIIQSEVVPFEHQLVRSESLPEGERMLSQQGANGEVEITYRLVYEDGQRISNDEFKRVVIKEAVPEIVVVGIQQMFSPAAIPGRLAYIVGGNAWVMEGDTGQRRVVVTGGDLDGYIFSLSSDGNWLLFTRKSKETGQINALWAARIDVTTPKLIDLKVKNVVYFASWVPGSDNTITYSTVEPQAAPPGWHTNNDLNQLKIQSDKPGEVSHIALDPGLIGDYPWWGVSFAWNPDGTRMAYANDHQVGLLDIADNQGKVTPLLNFAHLKTGSEWAWVPGLYWGPDGRILYTVDHSPDAEAASNEDSQVFDLTAILLQGGETVHLVSTVGMFAYPSPSPMEKLESGENAYLVAFFKAITPKLSKTSRYQVWVMDRDGSNQRSIFPEEGSRGLDPQQAAWSPAPLVEEYHHVIALIYQGNIWFINPYDGTARQITGDELTVKMDWK
jgi:Tol biopolymer transport system component